MSLSPSPSSISSSKSKQNNKTYPWSQKKLSSFIPFPRYNLSSSPYTINDKLYLFGGVSRDKATNDLFTVEINTLNVLPCYSSGNIPQPRSLHTQINVGTNLFVFGGKPENPNDKLDNEIYVLDTDPKDMKFVWNKPSIIGSHTNGRYGHTSTLVGTTVYIFGGQDNKNYLNDLISFDIKNFKSQKKKNKFIKFPLGKGNNNSSPTWNFIIPNNSSPPARSGHVACVYENRIYIFGGSDGEKYYNDTWCYDIQENTWIELVCIGYIPTPRQYHGAAIVNDVMYIFGGRVKEENEMKELGDLCAFRISNLRWYKFPNLGPSPSPRYGLAMTLSQDKVYIFGGESAQSKPDADGTVHILDTSKIKFPSGNRISQQRSSEGSPTEKTLTSSLNASKLKIPTGTQSTNTTVQQVPEENPMLQGLSPPPRPMSSQSHDSSKAKEIRPTRTILHQIPEENSSELISFFASPPQTQPPSQPLPPPPQSPPPPPTTTTTPSTGSQKSSKGKEVDRGPISIISPPTISQPKVTTSGIIMSQGSSLPPPVLKGRMHENTSVFRSQSYSPTNSEYSSYELQTMSPNERSHQQSPTNLNNNEISRQQSLNSNRSSRVSSQEMMNYWSKSTKPLQNMSNRREPFEIQGTIPENSMVNEEVYNQRTNHRTHRRTASQELVSSTPRVLSRRRVSVDNYSKPTMQELPTNYSPRVFPIRRASAENYMTNSQITEFPPRRTTSDNQRLTEFSSRGSLINNQRTVSPMRELSRRISIDDQKPPLIITEKSPKRNLVNNNNNNNNNNNQKLVSPVTSRRTSTDDQRTISPITEVTESSSKNNLDDDQEITSPITEVTELSSKKTLVDDQETTSPITETSDLSSKKTLVDDQETASPITEISESSLKKDSADDQKVSSPILKSPSKLNPNENQMTNSHDQKILSQSTTNDQITTSLIIESPTSTNQNLSPITESTDDQSTTSPIIESPISTDQNTTSPITESTDEQSPVTESPIDNQNVTSINNTNMASKIIQTVPIIKSPKVNNQRSSILSESLSRKKDLDINENNTTTVEIEEERIKNIRNILAGTGNSLNSNSPNSSVVSISSIDKNMKRDSFDSIASSDSNQSNGTFSNHRNGKETRLRGARPIGDNRPNNGSPLCIRMDSVEMDRKNLRKLREKLARSKFSDSDEDLTPSSSPSEIVIYKRSNENTPILRQSRSQSSNSSVSDFKLNNDNSEIQPEPEIDEIEPETDEIEPETDEIEPETDEIEPETDEIEPETDEIEPETDEIEPETDEIEPETDEIESEGSVYENNEDDTDLITTSPPQSYSNIDDENLIQELEQHKLNIEGLKQRESWYQAELDSARKSGFTPDLNDGTSKNVSDPINEIEQMLVNEVDDDIDFNTDQSRVIESIIRMQQKLLEAKTTIANQAQIVSDKISTSELARSSAIQEASHFKAKLEALTKKSKISSAESNKAKELENELIKVVSENKILENKVAELSQSSDLEKSNDQINIELSRAEAAERAKERVLAKLTALKLRTTTAESKLEESNKLIKNINNEIEHFRKEKSNDQLQIRNLQSSLSQQQQIFEQVNMSVKAANERAEESEQLWKQSRNDILKLEKEVMRLRIELENKTKELDHAVIKISEMENSLDKVQKEGHAVRNMMQEGMTELLNINWWDKVSNNVWENAKIRKLEEELARLKSMQDESVIL